MSKLSAERTAKLCAWGLSSLVIALAIIAWGNGLSWQFGGLTTYHVFPIFGLIAFSTMWSHYVISFLNKTVFHRVELGVYYKVTGYIVLVAIVFHPGLLAFQRFRDGYGIPEGSLTSYVHSNMRWIVLLGTVSLLTFLAFELHRWYSNRSWWRYVVYANDAAMLAILYHSLHLGTNLKDGGWLRAVWYVYGVSLIAILLFNYSRTFMAYRSGTSQKNAGRPNA